MIKIYDPSPSGNEYASFYFSAIRKFDPSIAACDTLDSAKNCTLILLSDYITEDVIQKLKNSNVKIVGFNVTDSSYISGACRYAQSLSQIDLMFSLTGIQTLNYGEEFEVDPDFNVKLVGRRFLDPEHWEIFDDMRVSGKLQSLPYVPWHPLSDIQAQPYNTRSQKALIRGGGHSRRFILAMFLIQNDLLDINSGLVLAPYFADGMNPAFRYCSECRAIWKSKTKFTSGLWLSKDCANPHAATLNMSNLGEWNNKCPASFYRMAHAFSKKYGHVRPESVEALLNAKWLHPDGNLSLLSRITFTSDLKWLFSIYAPQRFWEAASVGCINVLPSRTADQEYFPKMTQDVHYTTYHESMDGLDRGFNLMNQIDYANISREAMQLYRTWIKPTDYPINSNLLQHIMDQIRIHT